MDYEEDIVTALNRLESHGNSELQKLLDDEDEFQLFLKENEKYKELLESQKETLLEDNRALAYYNLAKKPELEEGKKELQTLSEKGSQLCTSVQEKLQEIKEKSGTTTVEEALELLQAAAAEIEEESEKVAEKFLAGDMEVDEFLDQFLTQRKLMHLRRVKVDKMKDLRKSKTQPKNPGYPVSGYFPGMAPSVPYPTGLVSMPMPVPGTKY